MRTLAVLCPADESTWGITSITGLVTANNEKDARKKAYHLYGKIYPVEEI